MLKPELTSMLSDYISMEIDLEILDMLILMLKQLISGLQICEDYDSLIALQLTFSMAQGLNGIKH